MTATKRVLALQDGPCILVAHSYGGAVITEAGTDPSVAGLVYVAAAHMPDAVELLCRCFPSAPIRNVPPEEVRLKRTAMRTRELRRAEVLARVKGQTLRLVDAAKVLELTAISRRRSHRAPALQRRQRFESGEAREIPAEGAAAHSGEVLGNREQFGPTLAADRTPRLDS
jgi:pimeloyl-ACP methyl ester carboxylesterase